MNRCIVLLALALADRITELPAPELCGYKARLYAIGYFLYLQGWSREQVPIFGMATRVCHEHKPKLMMPS